jgi:hypothetical protein
LDGFTSRDQAAAVSVVKRAGGLVGDISSASRRNPALLGKHSSEAAALDQFHDEEVLLAVLPAVVRLHDVGMRQPRQRHRLAAKARHRVGVSQLALGQHLDGDVAAERQVAGAEDSSHAALAELIAQLVAPGQQRHVGRARRLRRRPGGVHGIPLASWMRGRRGCVKSKLPHFGTRHKQLAFRLGQPGQPQRHRRGQVPSCAGGCMAISDTIRRKTRCPD